MPKKNKKPTVRDPMFNAVRSPQYRPRVEKSAQEKEERKAPMSRKAKHKARFDEGTQPTSLAEFYQIGDRVEVVSGPVRRLLARADKIAAQKSKDDGEAKQPEEKNPEGVVRSFGPQDTLGVTVDGEYHLINPDDAKLIYEAFHADDFEALIEWSYTTTTAGFQVPIGAEEQSILDKCAQKMYKSNLDDREQEVARLMVSKGILNRSKDEQGIYFTSGKKKLTRF